MAAVDVDDDASLNQFCLTLHPGLLKAPDLEET
jgi:hypothetical protein